MHLRGRVAQYLQRGYFPHALRHACVRQREQHDKRQPAQGA